MSGTKDEMNRAAAEVASGCSTAVLVVALVQSIQAREDISADKRRELIAALRPVALEIAGADELLEN